MHFLYADVAMLYWAGDCVFVQILSALLDFLGCKVYLLVEGCYLVLVDGPVNDNIKSVSKEEKIIA